MHRTCELRSSRWNSSNAFKSCKARAARGGRQMSARFLLYEENFKRLIAVLERELDVPLVPLKTGQPIAWFADLLLRSR